jgi:hypothetical protein
MDQSPVDVVIGIRKDLQEFQRRGGKQALRRRCRPLAAMPCFGPSATQMLIQSLLSISNSGSCSAAPADRTLGQLASVANRRAGFTGQASSSTRLGHSVPLPHAKESGQ